MIKKFILVFILLTNCFAYSQNNKNVPEDFESEQNKALVVEEFHHYKIYSFGKGKIIKTIDSKEKVTYKTPFDAIASHVSAMKNLDIKWFKETWDLPSIQFNQKKLAELKTNESDYIKLWVKYKFSNNFVILNQINYGNYVLIEYKLLSEDSNIKPLQDTVALIQVENEWKLTQSLYKNPLFNNWKTIKPRIQRIADSSIQISD